MKQNKIALCTIIVIVLSGMLLATTADATTAESGSTTTLKVTSADGKDITLTINGNIAAEQISELWFASNPALYNNSDIAFMLTNLDNTMQFMNMTVPRSALRDNTAPIVTIDGAWIKESGYPKTATTSTSGSQHLPMQDRSRKTTCKSRFA